MYGFSAKSSIPTLNILGLLCIKKLFNKEQIGYSEPFPVTNLPVYLINSEQIGIIEKNFDDQKVS